MKNYIDTILQEIKQDRTTGAVELVKKGVHSIALFISNFKGNSSSFFIKLERLISHLNLNLSPNLNLKDFKL